MSDAPRLDQLPAETFPPTYDQDSPASYFRVLGALDYSMPEWMAGFVCDNAAAIAAARNVETLRVMDFGCGYGAIGALIRHDVTMKTLSQVFAQMADAKGDVLGTITLPRRANTPDIRLGGLDVAARAVGFAVAGGLIDDGFSDDLTAGVPVGRLAEFLSATDLIVETGAPMLRLLPCLERMIDTGRSPWLACAPRPDTDLAPFLAMLDRYDYAIEPLSERPVFYRCLLASERVLVMDRSAAQGNDPRLYFDGDRMFVRPQLARPKRDIERLARADLTLMDAS